MRKIVREPLLYFLILALGLFGLFELANDDAADFDSRVITVSEETLLNFLQYRTQAFEPELALAQLREMRPEDLQSLIDEYVEEEALYREALTLGLDENDYIIKRRLVQSIEFITTGFATAGVQVSEDEARAYYDANRERYRDPPFVTFTHVYFSSEQHGREDALVLARLKLQELNENAVPFEAAMQHGDYFPYSVNYVEREAGFIAGQFGPILAQELFALTPDATRWQGPFESSLGFHLILLAERTESRIPPFAEIANDVGYDAERSAIEEMRDAAVQGILDTYTVRHEIEVDGEARQP